MTKPKTNRRLQRYRKKHITTIMLTPEQAGMLEELQDLTEQNRSKLVANLIAAAWSRKTVAAVESMRQFCTEE